MTDAKNRKIIRHLAKLEKRVAALESRCKGAPDTPDTAPTGPRIGEGVDVYWRTGDIDWSRVKAAGVEFAILKASEGQDFMDRKVVENAAACRAAGLVVNYYHFGRPDTGADDHIGDAKGEARDFLKAVEKAGEPGLLTFSSGRKAHVWLDLENDVPQLNSLLGAEWVLTWLREVEMAGMYVGLYSSSRWLSSEAAPDEDTYEQLLYRPDGEQRPFWVARYGPNNSRANPEYDPDEKVPDAWSLGDVTPSWDIWQYTSKGEVDGIPPGGCDRNQARLA